MAKSDVVVAAGGVIVRAGVSAPEILLIHRNRYDDWTLPKGKADAGETPRDTAVREVKEETGLSARIVNTMMQSRYPVEGVEKVVHWFAMRSGDSTAFVANEEVDEVAWLTLEAARERLSYDKEREVLSGFEPKAILTTGTFYLVRHGAAGDRGSWVGDDRDRPLSARGERQALALASELGTRPLDRILSSPYLRCRQTIEPLSDKTGVVIEEVEALAEGTGIKTVRQLCLDLIGSEAVLCSHGDVIPSLLQWMVDEGMTLKSAFDCKKGSTWVVEVKSGKFRRARYQEPLE